MAAAAEAILGSLQGGSRQLATRLKTVTYRIVLPRRGSLHVKTVDSHSADGDLHEKLKSWCKPVIVIA